MLFLLWYNKIGELPDVPHWNTMSNRPDVIEAKGICDSRSLPDRDFQALWDAVIIDSAIKDRLLGQAVLNFTVRPQLNRAEIPLHGVILLVGPRELAIRRLR